jgi:WD40 repeat protein
LVWDLANEGRLIKDWSGHFKDVESVEYSPDGSRLLSAHTEIKLWDTQHDWQPVTTTDWKAGWFAISPDGLQVSRVQGKTISLARLADGERVASWTIPANGARMTFGADGRLLAVASENGIMLLDSQDGTVVGTLRDETTTAWLGESGLRFHAEGHLLFSADGDQRVRVWDVASQRLLIATPSFSGEPFRLTTWRDADDFETHRMAVISGSELFVYELRAQGPLLTIATQPIAIASADMFVDGNSVITVQERPLPLVAGGVLHEAQRWYVTSGRSLAELIIASPIKFPFRLDGTEKPVISAAHDSEDAVGSSLRWGVYRWSDDGSVQWGEHPGLRQIPIDLNSVTNSGKVVLESSMSSKAPMLRLESTNNEPAEVRFNMTPDRIRDWPGDYWFFLAQVQPDAKSAHDQNCEVGLFKRGRPTTVKIPFAGLSNSHDLWLVLEAISRKEVESNSEIGVLLRLPGGMSDQQLYFKQLLVSPYVGHDKRVALKHAPHLAAGSHSGAIVGINHDLTQLMAWSNSELNVLSQFDRSKSITALASGMTEIRCVDVGRSTVVAGLRTGSVWVATPTTLASGREMSLASSTPVSAIVLTPDETHFAAGTKSGRIHWCEVQGTKLSDWPAHPEAVTAMSIDASGQWLASASEDKTVRLWRRTNETFHEYLRYSVGPQPATHIRLSGNARRLFVLVRGERAVRVLDVDSFH